MLKVSEWAVLMPEKVGESGSTRAAPGAVMPTAKVLSAQDPSTILL